MVATDVGSLVACYLFHGIVEVFIRFVFIQPLYTNFLNKFVIKPDCFLLEDKKVRQAVKNTIRVDRPE